ncbi:5prime-nucleotidase, C-terminal domain [Popillia japonica]|uniref:5prime-nucleotidase, C-terminal domain n=1 Tax=Popillia japonica TaxID=7064 RepID=A0AAW1N531_POPJA
MTHMIRIYKRAVKSVENDDEVLARSVVPLDTAQIRYQENSVANLVTDSFIYRAINIYQDSLDYSRGFYTDAAVSMINAGALSVVPLDTAQIRYQENSVANLVTDSFIYRAINIYQDSLDYSRGFYTDAAVSMINAGALRESFATTKTNPNITLGMVKELIPYRQHLVKLSLPGFVIVLCLEIGTASNGETNRGEFLQFSGLRMIYNHKSKAGYRVESVRIRCAECSQPTFGRLQQVDAYKVIITAFLANGGDGHSVIKSEGANLTVLPVFDVDVFAEYLRLVREIRPELNERIIDVGHSQNRWKLIPVLNGGSRWSRSNYHECFLKNNSVSCLAKLPPNASYVRRLWRRFRKYLLVSEKHYSTKYHFRSTAAMLSERKRQAQHCPAYIIHPFSMFAYYREIILFFVLASTFLLSPVSNTFLLQAICGGLAGKLRWVNFFTDVLIMCNVPLNFISGYLEHQTKHIVLEPRKIARHYLKFYFWVDLVGAVPILYFMPKLEKFEVLFLGGFSGRCAYTLDEQGRDIPDAAVNAQRHRLHEIHLVPLRCCLPLLQNRRWNLRHAQRRRLHRLHHNHGGRGCILGLHHRDRIAGYRHGKRIREQVRGTDEAIVSLPQVPSDAFAHPPPSTDVLRVPLPQTLLPRAAFASIMYYEYRFRKRYFREQSIMATLSEHLRYEIKLCTSRHLIGKVAIFKGLSKGVVGSIIGGLNLDIYLSNDVIIHSDTFVENWYLISYGTVAVVHKNGVEIIHLQDGECFGEMQIITGESEMSIIAVEITGESEMSIIAVEISEIFSMPRNDFLKYLSNDTIRRRIDDLVQERQTSAKIILERYALLRQEREEVLYKVRSGKILEHGRLRLM